MKTILALLFFFGDPSFAESCFNRDQAALLGARALYEAYAGAPNQLGIPDEFFHIAYERNYDESVEGFVDGFFKDGYEFADRQHTFTSPGSRSAGHATTLYVMVNCQGHLNFETWTEHD